MRRILIGVSVLFVGAQLSVVGAEEKSRTTERVVGGVISGLLGAPQPSPDAAYTAQERERLVSLLQSGAYVTSRQGEPIDLMVFGVPLTRSEHVYTAKPIPPSQTAAQQGGLQ